MASMTSFGQNGLKNGVYEYTFPTLDTTEIGRQFSKYEKTSNDRRTLIVKNDTVLYQIKNTFNNSPISYSGIEGDYYLNLEKISDSLYKAGNEHIELNIIVKDNKTTEIEVIIGDIMYFRDGGMLFMKLIILPPEKQTLIFVRDLTAEDEKVFDENQKPNYWKTENEGILDNLNDAVLIEKWIIQVAMPHYHQYHNIYYFYDNGQFIFKQIQPPFVNIKDASTSGTYHYQPETDKFFLTYSDTTQKCIQAVEGYISDVKYYLRWEIDASGNYYTDDDTEVTGIYKETLFRRKLK